MFTITSVLPQVVKHSSTLSNLKPNKNPNDFPQTGAIQYSNPKKHTYYSELKTNLGTFHRSLYFSLAFFSVYLSSSSRFNLFKKRKTLFYSFKLPFINSKFKTICLFFFCFRLSKMWFSILKMENLASKHQWFLN